MWLMTKYGFFSIVSAWRSETDQRPDPHKLMIRARKKEHLRNLQNKFLNMIGSVTITWKRDTDYSYRMIVCKKTMLKITTALMNEIMYTNFKNEVEKENSTKRNDDSSYSEFLHQVWYDGYQMQKKSSP